MLKNKRWLGIILSIVLLVSSITGFAYYKYTQESGANFYVGTADKADALEDTNEMRQIIDDLGNLLGHSKRDDSYPKNGTTGGYLGRLNYGLDASKPASPAVNDMYLATDTTKVYKCFVATNWVQIYPLTNIVLCSNYDHPDDAITAIASADKTLLVTEAETCDTNFTVPANVTVRFERGGKWTINTGVIVTFNGQIEAGLWQIFAYVGTGVITNLTQEVFTAWWAGDVGVQINAAVAALLNSRGTITIPTGEYSFNTEITLADNIVLQGEGQRATRLLWTGTNNTEDIITTNGNWLILRDFAITVGTGKSARSIIYITDTRSTHFSNLYLAGDYLDHTTTLYGVYTTGTNYYNLFENVFVLYCNENFHLTGSGVTENTFINCRMSNSGAYGFYGSGNKFVFVGCSFEHNSIALKITYGGAVIDGCYFETNTGTDIYIDHPKGVVVRGCLISNSATKDYSIYCTAITSEYKGIQIRDNIIHQSTGTLTTAIYLCSGAEASGNVFNVISGAITNEYNTPTGSRVNECPLVFPSTQISSTNANTLDDYKEDNWTPDLQFGGAKVGITYTLQGGEYTKIGRQVTATGIIVLSSKGSSVGNALIEGLPYTSNNTNGAFSAVSLKLTNVSFANAFQGTVNKNTSTITLQEITEAGVQTTLTNADFADNSTVVFSVTYFTD